VRAQRRGTQQRVREIRGVVIDAAQPPERVLEEALAQLDAA